MKTQLKRIEKVEQHDGYVKYSTQVENMYIYDCQLGWGYPKNILSSQKDNREYNYNEKSIIIEYAEMYNNDFYGQATWYYSWGTKSKFNVERI